ncbi:MAG TPA: L-lactate permease [Ilumatobacter sp.]|nr:L-lactate permease [Ilumatobacter sp.]
MDAALAASPVLLVLVLMIGLGWSAARAGAVTGVFTLFLAVGAFDFGGADDPFGAPTGVLGVLAEAAFITATVVAIIGPALGIHHLQEQTGATDRLRSALARLHPDPRVGALLIAWFFCLFMEGAAGFGTPVALAAPFLVAAGFQPVTAVAAALVGHAAGVSFGAVGTPVVAQLAIVDVSGLDIARATATYHLFLGWILLAVVLVLIGRSSPDRAAPWRWGILAGILFFLPFGLIAFLVGPELPTLGGALVGVVVFALVAIWHRRSILPELVDTDLDHSGSEGSDEVRVLSAAAPYLVLVGLVLVTRLVTPLRDLLERVEIEWRTDAGFTGAVLPLVHPALLLTAAFGAGAVAQRASLTVVREAFWMATRRLGPVVVALVAMVTIARAMSHAGMTVELADAAATTGAAWPLLAPAVGALGTFVTGSATASNVLFTELQESTAEAADLPVTPLLGAQGFGAAVGNIICPHNIVAAVATVGLTGQEGPVLRRTLPTAAVYVALGGAVALVLTR